MNFVPVHAEDLTEHALNEVMAQGGAVSGFAAGGREADDAVRVHVDEAITFEALERHGDGGGRDLKPVSEDCGNYLAAFGLGFEDGLEVVLLGYVDGVLHSECAFSLNRSCGPRWVLDLVCFVIVSRSPVF